MGVGDEEQNGKPILLVYVDNENSELAKKLETKQSYGEYPIKIVVSNIIVVDRIFLGAMNRLICGSLPLEKKILFMVQQESKYSETNISKAQRLFVRRYSDEDGFAGFAVGTDRTTGEPNLRVCVDKDSILAKKLETQKSFNGYPLEIVVLGVIATDGD